MTFWYQTGSLWTWLLAPISGLYRGVIGLRRAAYQAGLIKSVRVDKPVIVVGNITVGGTGKTPVIIELAKQLQTQGYKPGVISRGYGGKPPQLPYHVTPDSQVHHSGDEPLLIAQKVNCPVVVDPNRPRAANYAIHTLGCDILLSDDGLQHYALHRDVEIIVQDNERGLGNGFCLPAGPLREPVSRLASVDYILEGANVTIDRCYALGSPTDACDLQSMDGPFHAVAGLGNPDKFFQFLRHHKLDIIEHPFPDHHVFDENDLMFNDDNPIIMTEKDAVKCRAFAQENHIVLAIRAQLPNDLLTVIQKVITCKPPNH